MATKRTRVMRGRRRRRRERDRLGRLAWRMASRASGLYALALVLEHLLPRTEA